MLRLVDEDGDILIVFDEDDVTSMAQHYPHHWQPDMCDAVADWYEAKTGVSFA